MKLVFVASLVALATVTGCASTSTVPAGMKVGQFVTFDCEGGKRFQARMAEGGETVRVRYEGGYELDRKEAGIYESEGWKLVMQGPGATELQHNGKTALKNCKAT